MAKLPMIKTKDGERYFYRLSMNQRIQHGILAFTVVTLVLTGMPLKFHDASWAPYLYAMFGGIKIAPWIHKITGAILMCLFVYHVFYLVYIIRQQILDVKKTRALEKYEGLKIVLTQNLVPNLKDAFDIRDLMKYLFYLTNKRPDGDNFTWKEKFDYWAPFWGMIIIGLSGIVLWNKEIASYLIPGGVMNFLLIAHSDEALLAALFLFIWHWYNVHFSISVFPMGTVFLTGYLSEELMREEHYQYYVEMMKKEGLEDEILPPHGGDEHGSHEEGGQS